jgi:Uma2 family endonuclease
MQLALPDLDAPATLILDRRSRLSDDDYFAFCMANPDLQIERTAQGEIVIVPPAGYESDYRNTDAAAAAFSSFCPTALHCRPMPHGFPTSASPD